MCKQEYLYIPLFMLMTVVVVLAFFLSKKSEELKELEVKVRAFELEIRAKEERMHQLEQELTVLDVKKKELERSMKKQLNKEIVNNYIKVLEEENVKLREQVLILKNILDYERSFSKGKKKSER